MRRLFFSLLLSLACVTPAMSQDTLPRNSFGKATCGPKVLCSSYTSLDRTDPKITQLLSMANTCVANYFGIINEGSVFRDELGLRHTLCLETKPLPKAERGATPTPHCCLVQLGQDECQLQCDLLAVK